MRSFEAPRSWIRAPARREVSSTTLARTMLSNGSYAIYATMYPMADAIGRLVFATPSDLKSSLAPVSAPDSIARAFSRTVVRLLTIEWVDRTDPETLLDHAPVVERLRDAMLLTDRVGAHNEAIELAVSAVDRGT